MAIHLYTKSAEVKLMETLGRLRNASAGWNAVHFHLSSLLDQYKSEYQVKIAVNLIHDLLKNYEGGIFLLVDNSIIVMHHNVEKAVQNKLVFQLRYLYMDDPLAYTDTGLENPEFCTHYDLKRDWDEFHELGSRRMAIALRKAGHDRVEKEEAAAEKVAAATGEKSPKEDKHELSASKLATIERDLSRADLQRVLRRQPVCGVLPNNNVRRVFDELYIHIAHLRQMLKQDVDFLSNRWLFKYLTHILDERMIELIRHNPTRYLDSPISLNLNVETLLSPWFADFDASIKPSNKVAVVIEVPVVDVFSDMGAFIAARDEVQKMGYRVCLDGLNTRSFTSINRERLGLDLVKVQWNADESGDLKSRENVEMAEAVQSAGNNRVILCRCDNKSAIEYGQALGISLFQGRYLDNVLNPTSKQQN